MLTKEALATVVDLPSITEISLQLLQEFYDEFLCSNTYVYELNDGLKIILNFYPENFCHLVGLHHIAPGHLKKEYKALPGYQGIKEGRITFEHLKGINKPRFNSVKDKFRYFPYTYQLLQNPQGIEYDPSKVEGSKIRCKLILYDVYNNANVHLGIEEVNEGVGHYIARTFLIEKNKGDKFIRNQTSLNIKDVRVIHKLDYETMEQIAPGSVE